MDKISYKQKLLQMFILGYEEEIPPESFLRLVKKGLGGVIFFTRNIKTVQQFKNAVHTIKTAEKPAIPLFLSIDQEGGRVERTLNIHNGSHYLSAQAAAEKGEEFVKVQTQNIANELKEFGLNMNFAPVLDVNTNPKNPVIAERSFSSSPELAAKFGKICAKTYLENGIIPVGKHFPGHGETSVDSHKAMPVLDLSKQELEAVHIKPFEELIKADLLPAIMVAHIHYTAFDKNKIPASISKNVIENYLLKKLDYKGLVISDDMVMGGIKGFSSFEACKRGIEAGINLFIFRNADEQTKDLIERLALAAENGSVDTSKIDDSYAKIISYKQKTLTNV